MSPDLFLQKFDRFLDAPDAVAKLRELILHLAITGNLVLQDSTDQPAEGLLIEIRRSRDNLVKNGTLRRIETLPPLTIDDIPFVCPAGWAWVRFGEITSSYRGHNPPKSVFRENPGPGYVRFIQQRDFRTDNYAVYVPESRHLKLVKKGEIVMAAYGNIGNTCRTVEGAFNVAIAKVMEIPPIERDYIDLLIRSEFIRGALEKVSSRVAVSSMSSDHMRSLPVPLPPLAEQRRIVAKVDELMALCDRLEAQLADQTGRQAALARAALERFAANPSPAELDLLFHPAVALPPADLRKSILSLAVQGKLVPQDPNDEPAEALLSTIDSERRKFAIKYNYRAAEAATNNNKEAPFEIPTTWKWCKLSSLFNAITDGDHLAPPKSEDGIAFLTIGNITTGKLDFEDCRFVPETYYRELADFRRPVCGDILYTVVGATYGRAALVETTRPFCVQRHVAILKPPQGMDVGFLMTVLKSNHIYTQATNSTTGTAQPTVPLGSLRNFSAPLPPLAEQRRIVAKVEELMALVDRLEAAQTAARAASTRLLDAAIAELTIA